MDPEELNELERKEMEARTREQPYSPAGAPEGFTGELDEDISEGHDIDPTHPDLDSNIDSEELYQEGPSGAAEAAEPDDPGIAGYTPEE